MKNIKRNRLDKLAHELEETSAFLDDEILYEYSSAEDILYEQLGIDITHFKDHL